MADSLETTTPTGTGRMSVCKICGKLFDNPQKLSAHKRMVHPGMPGQGHATKPKGIYQPKNVGKFVCNICGNEVPQSASRWDHTNATPIPASR